jgi:hypothetical protein
MKTLLAINIYKYLYYINKNFSKKNPKLIYKLKDRCVNLPDNIFNKNSPIMKENMCDFANEINSGHYNLTSIIIWYLGEFVKSNEWINLAEKKLINKFKKDIIFYSVESYNKQITLIQSKLDQYNTLSSLAKYNKKNVFDLDENQKNELYYMVKSGEISYLLYAKVLEKGTFSINKYNINDLDMIRYIKIIDEIKNIKIEEIKIK